MGQGHSAQLAQLEYNWLLQFADSAVSYASHVGLECFEYGGIKTLAVAYQAATDVNHEGSRHQHIRFAISKDGGETWSPPRVVAWGGMPIWNPAPFFHKESNRLFLFYSESRKSMSPGGDVKYIVSANGGQSWDPPVTLYTHEADGEVPKVTANKPIVASDGNWYLPVHREPAEAYRTFNAKTFHPLKEAAGVNKVALPTAAEPQGIETSACVLVSSDKGASWKVGGSAADAKTWLIDGSLEEGTKKQLLYFFRSAAGRVYSANSADKGASWSRPTYTSLLNPNSKFATLTIDGQVLIAYNNSTSSRTPLSLALSVDDGRSWEPLAVIEDDLKGNFTSPSIVEWSDDTVKVAYTVWGEGIKLATIKLATVES